MHSKDIYKTFHSYQERFIKMWDELPGCRNISLKLSISLIGFIAEVNSKGLEVQDMRILVSDKPGIVDSHIVLLRP